MRPVIEQIHMQSKPKLLRRIKFAQKKEHLELRDHMIRALRAFFYERNFSEVSTPALQISPGLEPHLWAFSTEWMAPNKARLPLYLHTSPEFAMKKLLVSGMEKIFQIAPVYRNRERSYTHHPEFHMLEWYRVGASYTQIMEDCEGLLRACASVKGAGAELTWKGIFSNPFKPFEKISVQEAFLKYAQTDLLSTIDIPTNPSPNTLRERCRVLGISAAPDDTWEDLFFRVFLEKIEPNLGVGVPTILYDYPISMAALSRPKASDPRLAERFEIYVCGMELANAFGELTDPLVQRERFEADMQKKQALYGERYPIDQDFLDALEEGMPESAGIALGVDRLAMLVAGVDHIEDVLWVPVADV